MKPLTSDLIIQTVCEALQLDRDKLIFEAQPKDEQGRYLKGKYADASHIAAFLIRAKVKVPKQTKVGGNEFKTPTYKEIAKEFKRKAHWTVMNWELECSIQLRENKPEFKAKYDMVVNLLDKNVNIA